MFIRVTINVMLDARIIFGQLMFQFFLGRNSVSQREIQRCFNLIDFFWKLKYDQHCDEPNPIRCIALSLALIYYFRLPTNEDNSQRNDHQTPSREELGGVLSQSIPEFVEMIQNELQRFVNTDNFVIPHGVAVNQAVSLLPHISFISLFRFRFVNISFQLSLVLLLEHHCV